MQTGKFSIFDFEKLQDPNKRAHYDEIISLALIKKKKYLQTTIKNYTDFFQNLYSDKPPSYYIKRANEIINRGIIGRISLKTANEKILLMTSLVFSDNEKFIEILQRNGIRKEDCINFGEEIKQLHSYEEQQRAAILELLMQECFPNLNLIKTHYGINSTGVIINKILEIAYLHPELLHTKEKS